MYCSSCTPTTNRTAVRARCEASVAHTPTPLHRWPAAAAALYGPLHGGANEAVLRMLTTIESIDNVPAFVKKVKNGEGRLMGFGHRVYKSYDPRAKVIKEQAHEVFEVTGKNPLLDLALELERIALQDDYFVSRQLYPNVDFYSGLIYQAMGFKPAMFPRPVRDRTHCRMDRAVARDARRQGAEDRAAPAGLHRRGTARLRSGRQTVGPGPCLGKAPRRNQRPYDREAGFR